MPSARYSLRSTITLCATFATLLLATPNQAHPGDDDRCLDLEGPFSSVTVPVPPCESPVGLCTHGILAGPLKGASYDFTVETLTSDPSDPYTVIATGTSIVTTKTGQLFTDDVSVMHMSGLGPLDPVEFVTTATVVSGTQRWKHTTGEFIASGTIVFATGQAVGSYTALLCPERHGHGGGHCN